MANKQELNELLRELPAVEAVLTTQTIAALESTYRRDVLKRLAQAEIDSTRQRIAKGKQTSPADANIVAQTVADKIAKLASPGLTNVINASGVILHTNLGRAVLSQAARDALAVAADGYCDLEFDLVTGDRSHRDDELEDRLVALLGCEAATVVNNCAAAVWLTINTLASGGEVVTSRGELVEIGGAFRVPDVVRSSGGKMIEVGTTNRTRLSDYEQAITPETKLLLKTHTSNFRIRGFTEDTSTSELVALGKVHGIPVFHDLGSGYIEPETGSELAETGIFEALAEGPGLVAFSGDKLMGGPQAGVIVGKRDLVAEIRKNPLWRALRIDKFASAALSATISEHLKQPGVCSSGIAAMLQGRKPDELHALAEKLADGIRKAQPNWDVEVTDGTGSYGGGSLPDEAIESRLVVIKPAGMEPEELHEFLRLGSPPVVGYPKKGAYVLNVLSLLPGDADKIISRFEGIAGE